MNISIIIQLNNGDPAGIKNGILTDYQLHLVDVQKSVDY